MPSINCSIIVLVSARSHIFYNYKGRYYAFFSLLKTAEMAIFLTSTMKFALKLFLFDLSVYFADDNAHFAVHFLFSVF